MIPILLGVFALKALVNRLDRESAEQSTEARSPSLPMPLRFARVHTERLVTEDRVEYDDEGAKRSAIRYSSCEWNPLPWTLTVWTDEAEKAELFALTPHPEVKAGELRVSIRHYWHDKKDKRLFEEWGKELERDTRFRNRLIHRYVNEPFGMFMIDVRFDGKH